MYGVSSSKRCIRFLSRCVLNCCLTMLSYLATLTGFFDDSQWHLGQTILFLEVPRMVNILTSNRQALWSPGLWLKGNHLTAVIARSAVAHTPLIGWDPWECVCGHSSSRKSFIISCNPMGSWAMLRQSLLVSTCALESIVTISRSPDSLHWCSCHRKSDSNKSLGVTISNKSVWMYRVCCW